jgi:hypothetical protein
VTKEGSQETEGQVGFVLYRCRVGCTGDVWAWWNMELSHCTLLQINQRIKWRRDRIRSFTDEWFSWQSGTRKLQILGWGGAASG